MTLSSLPCLLHGLVSASCLCNFVNTLLLLIRELQPANQPGKSCERKTSKMQSLRSLSWHIKTDLCNLCCICVRNLTSHIHIQSCKTKGPPMFHSLDAFQKSIFSHIEVDHFIKKALKRKWFPTLHCSLARGLGGPDNHHCRIADHYFGCVKHFSHGSWTRPPRAWNGAVLMTGVGMNFFFPAM